MCGAMLTRVCASASMRPQLGVGGCATQADVAEGRFGKDPQRELDRRLHNQQVHHGWAGYVPLKCAPRFCQPRGRARINSRSQRGIAAPRTTRAKTGMLKMPMAMIAFTAPRPEDRRDQDRDHQRGKGENQIVGAHDQFVNPRAFARRRPKPQRNCPAPCQCPTATNATAIEVRAPTIIMLNMSRPEVVRAKPVHQIGGLQLFGNVSWRRDRKASTQRDTSAAITSDQRQGAADDQIAVHVRALNLGSTAA